MRTVLVALLLASCGKKDRDPDGVDTDDTDNVEQGAGFRFVPYLVDGQAAGARHPVIVDLQGTGRPDIVVSINALTGDADSVQIPAGRVVRYRWTGGGFDGFVAEDLVPESAGLKHPNRVAFHDVDGDGDLDLIVPGGSPYCDPLPNVDNCGTLTWFENTGNNWVRRPIVENSLPIFTGVALADIDGDGIADLVATAEDLSLVSGVAVTTWFKGTGNSQGFRSDPYPIGLGGGPLPVVVDLDGDGDLDVVVGERITPNTFVWFEQTGAPNGENPGGTWQRRVLDDSRGPGWMMAFVPDFFGDGVTRAVGTNHTNTVRENNPHPWESEVVVYNPPSDVTQTWSGTAISEGIEAIRDLQLFKMEAPGVFAWGDADGDGDIDLVVAGDGDNTVYLLEQTAPGDFDTRILRAGIARNGVAMGDINGDGRQEIVVTGQIDNVVYVIAREDVDAE